MMRVNEKVLNSLDEKYSDVVINTWFIYIKDCRRENENIIIEVPNRFIKDIIEDRYLCEIEMLYRNEISFDDIIIEVTVEKLNNIKSETYDNQIEYKSADDYRSIAEMYNDAIDIDEKIQYHIKNIFRYIESRSQQGGFSTVIIFDEKKYKNEILNGVLKFLKEKGFESKVEQFSEKKIIINVSWK